MTDWVHCNKCLTRPTKSSGTDIQITSCGHLFCNKCMEPGKSNQCLICHGECTLVLISNSMSPEISFYFQNTADILQKFVQVLDFQNNHRRRLLTNTSKELEVIQSKYVQAKEHIRKVSKNQSNLEKENQEIKEHINKISRDLARLQNDNQRLRNFIKMSAGSPSPSVPVCRGQLSSGGSNTSLLSRPALPNPSNSTNTNGSGSGFIMRGQSGSNTNMSSANQSWMPINQTQKPDMTRKQFIPEAQRPQLTPNRLILPRTTQYRTPEQFNASTDKDSSPYNRMSNFSLASGGSSLSRFGTSHYSSPLNMSGLSLNSKTSIFGRK